MPPRIQRKTAESGAIRVELANDLEGFHILVEPDALTMGLLEDIQAGSAGTMLDAVVSTISGSDLPHGHDRTGLRKLTPSQFADLCAGVASCIRLKKAT
jgi:hypothetical protein